MLLENLVKSSHRDNRFIFTDRENKTRIDFLCQTPGTRLDFQGPEGRFTFQEDEIDQQQSSLGLLITVTLKPDLGAGGLSFMLILPPVNLVEPRQDWATVAVLTQSRGLLSERAGAELTYKELFLLETAENTIFANVPLHKRSNSLHVQEVSQVYLSILIPPQLEIKVLGTVPSADWSNPQLVPFSNGQTPSDGIYDFDFVATPPQNGAAVVSPITAQYGWKAFPEDLTGIRIHGATNFREVLLFPPSDEIPLILQ